MRERELVAATRALFDEQGIQDAPVEKIARQVGIARGLIYRHFSSKDELYVLTVTHYLDELAGELEAALAGERDPVARLERSTETYANYCLRYPAFIDCTLALMRRPGRASCTRACPSRSGCGSARASRAAPTTSPTSCGRAPSQAPSPSRDADYMANVLWTQTLGIMHLARIRVGIRQLAPGVPGLFKVAPEDIVQTCVASAMATVGAQPR